MCTSNMWCRVRMTIQVRGVPLADVFFVLFAGVFFVSRIIVYPRYLLWSALYVHLCRPSPRTQTG